MSTRLNPYLSFKDTARSAMTFYQEVFGGELALNTFGEFGGGGSNLIMHSMLESSKGFTLMAGDAPEGMEYVAPRGMSVSLSGDDADELRGYWNKLSDGGTVTVPLERQVWGDEFGMCIDKFGVPWMVNISSAT